MYNWVSASGVLKSLYPLPVNTIICVPHFHNFFWLSYNDQKKSNRTEYANHYILKWKDRFFFSVEEKVQANTAHSDHLSQSEEQETTLRFKHLITLVKMISLATGKSDSEVKCQVNSEIGDSRTWNILYLVKSPCSSQPHPPSSMTELWKLSCVVKLGTLSSNKTLATNNEPMICLWFVTSHTLDVIFWEFSSSICENTGTCHLNHDFKVRLWSSSLRNRSRSLIGENLKLNKN